MGNCKSKVLHIPDVASTTYYSDEYSSSFRTGAIGDLSEHHDDSPKEDPVIVIRQNIIGGSQNIITPFGIRKIVYADYTASGRHLKLIEDYLSANVYPFYANTHTEASATGAITTNLREEARLIVSKRLHAPRDKYAVFFVGTGCTGAIEKIMKLLGIWIPEFVTKETNLLKLIPEKDRPIIFIGPFEHHSNELPWRESIATVVVIPEDDDGCPDLKVLEARLSEYKDRRVKIGSFCAGSNVTGICIDTKKYSRILHKHNALAFFDFAGSGAYVEIDASGESEDESMDAIFMSPHKFIGGPGCSGLLVAKRSIFKSIKSPTFPGGGTVSFVSPCHQDYDDNIEAREDAGTPGIIQAIRTGLVFQLKEMVGCKRIEAIERRYCKMAFDKLGSSNKVELVGSNRGAYFDPHRRVTIMSFNIRSHFRARCNSAGIRGALSDPRVMLHPAFVVALLNDVYGIQARAGCSCTGPYSHRLFDIDDKTSDRVRDLVAQGYHAFKFGWARVNFNYFISPKELEFICDAILQIAEHGWKLLPLYQADLKSSVYTHHRRGKHLSQPSLTNFQLSSMPTDNNSSHIWPAKKGLSPPTPDSPSFQKVLKDAKRIYDTAGKCLRIYGQQEEHKAEELHPSSIISPNDIWWVTEEDVMESFRPKLRSPISSSKKDARIRHDAWSTALEI